MGRTARTAHDAINIEEKRWSEFRRTLRPARRDLLDRVFDYARKSSDAATMIVTPRVTEVILLSAMLEILSEMDELRRRLEEVIKETSVDETARMASGRQY